MLEILKDLVINTLISSPIVIFISKAVIDHINKKNLASYTNELNLVTEAAKLTHQKELLDFTHFTSKRHELIPELYRMFQLTNGHISDLVGPTIKVMIFSNINDEAVLEFFKDKKIPISIIKEKIEMRKVNKEKGNTELNDLFRGYQYSEAKKMFGELNNFYYINSLYFSDETSEISEKLLKCFRTLMQEYYFTLNGLKAEYGNNIEAKDKSLKNLKVVLQKNMKSQ
ncbi:hypothetical protein IFT92_15400 [Peribacillus simplex]|uniref:hypothetical protein n=1 Tax=Peribacillus simplex TaxID=1478 RepID=UPI001924D9C3|nr:hypothetical protein [Peribacillus simplex]MBD8589186.1 hypothetical protein [Peribacillus simplex]